MKTVFLMLILSVPPQAPPIQTAVGPSQAPTVKEFLTVPDDYNRIAKRCAAERKPLVIFSGVPVRQIAGLTVCHGTFAEKGIIIGIPSNGWFDRYDLPADVSDDAIRAFIFSKITQRKEARQEAILPTTFRQQVFRSGGRGGSC